MKQVPRRQAIRAWHFLHEGDKLRTGEVAPADGKWLTLPGTPRICVYGLHASRDPFDALEHAPGPVLCLVDCAGMVDEHEDKLVCTGRRIVARMDAAPLLRHFARQQALSVAHLWEPPEIVLDWLVGGLARSAAWSAAWSAALSAEWSAESAEYRRYANELIRLLKDSK